MHSQIKTPLSDQFRKKRDKGHNDQFPQEAVFRCSPLFGGGVFGLVTAGEITAAQLERALVTIAELVLENEAYLPIFERLNNELSALRAKRDLLAQARRIVDAHRPAITSDSLEPEMQ